MSSMQGASLYWKEDGETPESRMSIGHFHVVLSLVLDLDTSPLCIFKIPGVNKRKMSVYLEKTGTLSLLRDDQDKRPVPLLGGKLAKFEEMRKELPDLSQAECRDYWNNLEKGKQYNMQWEGSERMELWMGLREQYMALCYEYPTMAKGIQFRLLELLLKRCSEASRV